MNYPKCRYKLPMHENLGRKFRNKILENQSVPVFSTGKVDSAIISEEPKQEQSENNESVIDIRVRTDPQAKEVVYQVQEDIQLLWT